LKLVDTLEELDVSGGAALERRPGLSRAVDLVERGKAAGILSIGRWSMVVRQPRRQLTSTQVAILPVP
jgi:hypothetical protein